RTAERVEAAQALLYGNLVLEESRSGRADSLRAARMLFEHAREAGVARFADVEEIDGFLARVQFASAHSAVSALGPGDVEGALESLCAGLKSFQELKAAAGSRGLLRALEQRIPAGSIRTIQEVAP